MLKDGWCGVASGLEEKFTKVHEGQSRMKSVQYECLTCDFLIYELLVEFRSRSRIVSMENRMNDSSL